MSKNVGKYWINLKIWKFFGGKILKMLHKAVTFTTTGYYKILRNSQEVYNLHAFIRIHQANVVRYS